jgi:hypothetical protein
MQVGYGRASFFAARPLPQRTTQGICEMMPQYVEFEPDFTDAKNVADVSGLTVKFTVS